MNEPITQIKDTTGNPAPLGLLGFGMTTVLLNLHNAGFYELNSMILAMGICYGGAAQIIAGIMEWKKGNTFATTAFVSYGFVLVVTRGIDRPAETGMGRPVQRHGHGCLPGDVGTVHRRHVYWHIAAKPRPANCFRNSHNTILSPRHR